MFPMVLNDRREWAGLLALSRETVSVYDHHAKDLKKYILDWEKDYRF
jgi:hypothetical protein